MSLITHLQQQISGLLTQYANQSVPELVVAYSGGVDSHVLLHALWRIREARATSDSKLPAISLSAIHIHHGLNDKADHWQLHCQQVCADLAVPLLTARVKVEKLPRHSLEAQARQARYAKLSELAAIGSIIVLAQHQDDQLETVLLQLKRGAGPKGLSGMASISPAESPADIDPHPRLFRPLLAISQQQIIDYAQQYSLGWQEDDSNHNTDFERNFLRHKILPLLTERWPQFARCVARSAQLCAEQQSLLDEVSQHKLLSIGGSQSSLDITLLCSHSESWQRQLVRTWLAQQNVPCPSHGILQQLIYQFLGAQDDANPLIQWQNWQFRRFNKRLYVLRRSADLSGICLRLPPGQEIQLPQKIGRLRLVTTSAPITATNNTLTFAASKNTLQVRFGGYAERFKPLGKAHSKPLKQWFKLWQIPPWQRNEIAIITLDDQVLGLVIEGKLLPGEPYLEQNCQELCLHYLLV